jgi:hypothetical protein
MEYDLGLLTTGNEVKPTGARFKQLIREFRTSQPTAIDRPDALILPDGLLGEPQAGPRGWQFARRYMQCLEEGFRPAIVLESRATDSAYLASRGIRNLIGGLQAGASPSISISSDDRPVLENSVRSQASNEDYISFVASRGAGDRQSVLDVSS